MSGEYKLIPKVDEVSEFLEISRDFTNPLESVREAISNAYDARAKRIQINFLVKRKLGEGELTVTFIDDGRGMDREGLQSFFDLGNSLSRGCERAIGAKGHGTKVFLSCSSLKVETLGPDGIIRTATMNQPLEELDADRIPQVDVIEGVGDIKSGTKITLKGFNRNRRDTFTHKQLKDYIVWFTKFGAIEQEFDIQDNKDMLLFLKGVDIEKEEPIKYGHVFPDLSEDVHKLFDELGASAHKHYVGRWKYEGTLKNHPEIPYQAVYYIEGDSAKRKYNKMLTGTGRKTEPGMYPVTSRYGLYLCKDYIPVERTVGWLGSRSTDHLLYHAFINCPGFELTANRGSVSNTPQPILDDIREIAEVIRRDIVSTDEFDSVSYLKQEAAGWETAQREEIQYKKRVKLIANQKVCNYSGVELIEPRQESGVFALVTQVAALNPKAFPFEIVDYDTSVGMDALAKTRDGVAVGQTHLRYIEFKYLLKKAMNHTFKHMHSLVTWDLHSSVKHESMLEDNTGEKRSFIIVPPEEQETRTRFYLDARRTAHKIEVFVLKEYLKETLGLEFKRRTE